MLTKEKVLLKINSRIDKISKKPNFFKKGRPHIHCQNDVGILLLPGFANTSHIMREYAEFLIKKGFSLYNVTLPGRGTTLEELSKTTWTEWVESAIEDYNLFRKVVKKVYVAGFSAGAIIALYMSQVLNNDEKPDGLILLSPSIFLSNKLIPMSFQITAIRLLSLFQPYPSKSLKNIKALYVDDEARKEYEVLSRLPAKSIIELLYMIKEVKKNIRKVSDPYLIIQAKNDVIAKPHGAKWIIKNTLSAEKYLCELTKSGHPVMVDVEKNKVFNESFYFINRNSTDLN